MGGTHRRDHVSDRQKPEAPTLEAIEPVVAEAPPARAVAPPAGISTDVEFRPRSKAREVVGRLIVAGLCGLSVATYAAFQAPDTLTLGLAATLLVLTLALWAIRTSSPVTYLAVRSGQLEVTEAGGRQLFDLSGGFSPIEVVGTPGDRGWRVLFHRRGMDPFVVDSSIVDPHTFMDTLRRYRPE
jgi:hypothetical protein